MIKLHSNYLAQSKYPVSSLDLKTLHKRNPSLQIRK